MSRDLLDLLIAFSGLQHLDQSAAPCPWTIDTVEKQTLISLTFISI